MVIIDIEYVAVYGAMKLVELEEQCILIQIHLLILLYIINGILITP